MIKETKHRLARKFYTGCVICTFTICIRDRGHLFTNESVVYAFNDMLRAEIREKNIKNWVYVYMPDHLHLVLEGKDEKSDLWKAIVMFKQKTGCWLSKNKSVHKWQKDFFDHIHRKEEDLRKHIIYILNNPVRKGLVDNWCDYRFLGSLDCNLYDIVK